MTVHYRRLSYIDRFLSTLRQCDTAAEKEGCLEGLVLNKLEQEVLEKTDGSHFPSNASVCMVRLAITIN
jgi:hypothetical protein